MNNREEPERIMERRIMELQIQLAHSISEKELLEARRLIHGHV